MIVNKYDLGRSIEAIVMASIILGGDAKNNVIKIV
jgi:hypothetical protein